MKQKLLMTIALTTALFCSTALRAELLDVSCSGASNEVDYHYTSGDPNHADATLEKGFEWTVTTTDAGNVDIMVKFLDERVGLEAPHLFLFDKNGVLIGDPIPMTGWDAATQTATHTLTGKAAGEKISFLVKVAYADGHVIFTSRISYTIGEDCSDTPVENVTANKATRCQKAIENGQLVIIRDGIRYNALGTAM